MVQDVFSKADVLSTAGSFGAPNFRQSRGGFPLYGMGQPSLSGFKQVLQRLQGQGRQVSVCGVICQRLDLLIHSIVVLMKPTL